MRLLPLALLALVSVSAHAQRQFDTASIHLSSGSVPFERNGETQLTAGTLRMRDVTVSTCIKLAYDVQQSQIIAPPGMDNQHYDVQAKADAPATPREMRVMLQQLLSERFGLGLHRGTKDLDAYVVTVAAGGLKMKPSQQPDGEPAHQNSAMGMVAKNFSMKDLLDYVSEPLGAPMVDDSHLPGRYDFTIDFRPYVDTAPDIHADPVAVLRSAFQGELGLRMTRRHTTVETLVIDHVTEPTPN